MTEWPASWRGPGTCPEVYPMYPPRDDGPTCDQPDGHDGLHHALWPAPDGHVRWSTETVDEEAERLAVAAAIENGGRVPGHDDVDEDLADVLDELADRLVSDDVDDVATAVRQAGLTSADVALVAAAAVEAALPQFRAIVSNARALSAGWVGPRALNSERTLALLLQDLCDTHEGLLRLVEGLVRQVELLAREP